MNQVSDTYESPVVRVVAALLVVVPLALLAVGTYWVGTWTGGVMGGVASVAVEAVFIGILFLRRRARS